MTLPKRVEHRQPRVRRDLASALLSAAEGSDGSLGAQTASCGAKNPTPIPNCWHCANRCADTPSTGWPIGRRWCGWPSVTFGSSGTTRRSAPRSAPPPTRGPHLRPDRRTARPNAGTWRPAGRGSSESGNDSAAASGETTPGPRYRRRTPAGPDLQRERPAGGRVPRSGVWKGLAPAELAACCRPWCSSRGGDGPTPVHAIEMPTPAVRLVAETRPAVRRAARRRTALSDRRLRQPDQGSAPPAIHRWATTGNLTAGAGCLGCRRQRLATARGRFRALVPSGARPARSGAHAARQVQCPERDAMTSGAASWLLTAVDDANATVGNVLSGRGQSRHRGRNDERTAGVPHANPWATCLAPAQDQPSRPAAR